MIRRLHHPRLCGRRCRTSVKMRQQQTECPMHRHPLILAASFAPLMLAVACTHTPSAPVTPSYITAAVADPNRPDADKQRDANRKPTETLEFAGVMPGEQIGELIPGTGYFTRLFSKAVGP